MSNSEMVVAQANLRPATALSIRMNQETLALTLTLTLTLILISTLIPT